VSLRRGVALIPKAIGVSRVLLWVAVAAVAGLVGAGTAIAAISVTHHVLTAVGSEVSETNLGWWTEWGLYTGTIPATVPPAGGSTAATPVVLAGTDTSYTIGTAVAGHQAVVFVFNESTAAPASTEIEIAFTVGIGGAASTTTTVYMESQATIPTASLTFDFYFDSGTTTATAIIVTSLGQVSQSCSAVGSCP